MTYLLKHSRPWKVASDEEAVFGPHTVCVYFDKDGNRLACDCLTQTIVGQAFGIMPDDVYQATMLWSETGFKTSMTLQEFLHSTLGQPQ